MIFAGKNKISIFSVRIEQINLLLPLIVLMLSIVELGVIGPLFLYSKMSFLVTSLIFFNASHVLLTYLMLLTVPAMKVWSGEGSAGGSRSFWFKSAFLFAALFAVYLLVYLKLSADVSWYVTIAFIFLHTQHTISQSRGLSLCYNQHIGRGGDELMKERIRKSELIERWGFRLFLLSAFSLKPLSGMAGLPVLYALAWLGLALGGMLIVAGALYLPDVSSSNKFTFLTRLVCYPLGLFSLAAACAENIAHGVEYVCVFNQVSENGFSDRRKAKLVLATGGILLVVYGGLYYSFYLLLEGLIAAELQKPLWVAVMQALLSALVIHHYYLDRMIFRMRDPHTRSQIAPLLTA